MMEITDALELLTAQHQEIDELVVELHQDPGAATLDNLFERLTAHLAAEQELFYPVVAPSMSGDVLGEVLQEHAAIKQVLAELVWLGVDDGAFRLKLLELGHLLCGHCGWQEEELFQNVAESMSAEDLVTLGDRLRETTALTAVAA